ncbi:MAG: PIG-L family deacetylase, partial [Comamonadaceae bacterium]|nr:PIG-L family deacetylase [Comamonadaceae bacterium]
MESDLIPYSACQGVPAQAALVLAPHPDDEIFGCGGAIARHVQAGVPVQVVVLTDGAVFGNTTLRRQECRAAAKMLGYGEPDFWHFPDRGLLYSEALVQRVLEKIIDGDTDLVYAPSPWELHPDHRQTASVAIEAVRRATKPVRLAFYEVGAPLRPNLLLDITPFVSIKEAAMKCFGSQLTQQDYLRHIRALNQFRTYTLPREVLAAEAFWLLSPSELVQVMEAGLLTLVSPGLSTERVASPRRLPQVTIMIRSMGRESLQEALDSVALQTYPNIKVVVVAATTNHPPLPQTCGPFALQLLETPLPLSRSQAANKALTHASGDFLLFLDDDDWLMPEHIARLAHVLSHQPHALAAYSGISLVDATGQPLGQTFDLPYDAIRQAAGNLTPIHAVLFSAKVIEKGCRFDETIELYEDWDFWLQLAKITTMVHVPGVTGAYRIHESSGVHVSSGPSGEAAEVIYRKWTSEWTPAQVGQMMLRVWSHQEMEESLAQAREQLLKTKAELGSLVQSIKPVDLDNAHLVSTVNDLSRQLEQEKQDRQLLLQSRSWRFTRPMRWVANMMRTSPIGWSVRKIREFRVNGFNMNLAALDLYRKACAYSNKYG